MRGNGQQKLKKNIRFQQRLYRFKVRKTEILSALYT